MYKGSHFAKEYLVSNKTLNILLSYSDTLADNCQDDGVSQEEYFLPTMTDLSPYLLGDENPIWYIYEQLRKKGTDDTCRIPAYFGGFHLSLETHKKGSLFGETHLHIIFRNWRSTEKQLVWAMVPGDPSQVDKEKIM